MDRILGFDAVTINNLLLQLCNTMILAAILAYLLYKPVKNFLKNRSDRISSQILTAEENLKQSQIVRAEYEDKLKNIEKERNEILDSSRKQALEKEEQIIREAREEAQAIRERAMKDIEREQAKVKDEIKSQIIEISTLMASQFIQNSIDENTQNKLLDEVISDLGEVKWLN